MTDTAMNYGRVLMELELPKEAVRQTEDVLRTVPEVLKILSSPAVKPAEKERKIMSLVAIGAALAALTGIGAGIGIGLATYKAVDAIARQPEAESGITKALLLGCALAEATAIYGFVVALLIIFTL